MLSTAQKQSCLQSCDLFSRLAPATLAVLAEAVDVERYADGEEVCEHGEEADGVYIIMDGTLAVFIPGVEQPVRKMGAGQIFGEYGMFAHVRTATIVSEGESTLLSMEYARFKDFLFQYPEAMYRLLAVAVSRLNEAEARLRGG